MSVSGRIEQNAGALTPAERKVASVVLSDADAVAFGTVADVARLAGASGATVVRLAAKLGYAGFGGLQDAVRQEMARRLRPAAARIRQPAPAAGALARALAAEAANVAATLEGADGRVFALAVRRLAARSRGVYVISGDASAGVAGTFATELSLLRSGVESVSGSEVRIARRLAATGPGDTLVVCDLPRYDRDVLDVTRRLAGRGVAVLALSDGPLSPLHPWATEAFTVASAGAGPFDSHTGMLALLNALLVATAERLRRSATDRLDAVEAAWVEAGVLVDG